MMELGNFILYLMLEKYDGIRPLYIVAYLMLTRYDGIRALYIVLNDNEI